MKVLIAGNEGFLAKKIAERFSADHDKLYYIGNSEIKRGTNFNVFSFSPSKDETREVFKTYRPDVVIYINNVNKDYRNDLSEKKVSEHVRGFFNLYTLANEYKANRFIYTSTESVYDKEIQTPDEESAVILDSNFEEAHYICEQHIINTKDSVLQKSLILRVSTLFNENPKDDKNIIDYLFNQASSRKNKQKVSLEKKYDLIHSDDFISALVTLKDFKENDVLNIGRGRTISFESLNILISEISNDTEISTEDIEDNEGMTITRVSQEYGFYPRKDLMKSLKNSIVAKRDYKYSNSMNKSLFKKIGDFFEKDFFKGKLFRTIVAYLENLVLFGLLLLLTDFFKKNLTNEFIDLRVAYIALVGLVHGIRQSSLSAVLCIAMVLINYEMNDYGLVTVIYDMEILITILVFVAVAMITGYVKDRFVRVNKELTDENTRVKQQLEYIRTMYNESIAVKDTLQFQVLNATDSYGRIFNSVEKLDSLQFDKLKTEIIIVTEEIMRNNSIAFYMVGRNTRFSRLISYSNKLSELPKSVEIIKYPEFNQVYQTHEMNVNRKISNNDLPLMISPIVNDGRVIAMLALYEAPLDVLTLSYENLFKITSRLVSQAIIRTYTYQEAQEDRYYVGNTQVLKANSFSQKLAHAQEASENEQASYVLLNVLKSSHGFLMENSGKFIREFDYVGMGENEEMFILLNNISKADLPHVVKRFKNNGIDTSVIKEVNSI